jgi:hypothetical protein
MTTAARVLHALGGANRRRSVEVLHQHGEPTGLQAACVWSASVEDVRQRRYDALDALVTSDAPDQRADAMSVSQSDTHEDPS